MFERGGPHQPGITVLDLPRAKRPLGPPIESFAIGEWAQATISNARFSTSSRFCDTRDAGSQHGITRSTLFVASGHLEAILCQSVPGRPSIRMSSRTREVLWNTNIRLYEVCLTSAIRPWVNSSGNVYWEVFEVDFSSLNGGLALAQRRSMSKQATTASQEIGTRR